MPSPRERLDRKCPHDRDEVLDIPRQLVCFDCAADGIREVIEECAKVAEEFFATGTYEAVKKGIAREIRALAEGPDDE